MIKGVPHAHLGPIWYHSEPSEIHYCPIKPVSWLGHFLLLLTARRLQLLNCKLIFAIKLSMERRMSKFWAANFESLGNSTVKSPTRGTYFREMWQQERSYFRPMLAEVITTQKATYKQSILLVLIDFFPVQCEFLTLSFVY